MKTKSLILILASTFSVAFSAFADSALENRAVSFLNDKWAVGTKAALMSSATPTPTVVTSHAIAGGMTAVNISAPQKLGFVLYADSGEEAYMLGYGVTDTLDINNLPPALAEFITSYTEQKQNSAVTRSSTSQSSSTYPLPTIDPVEPFIKTKWGQEAPFNGKCPLYQGTRSVTGCDATALGQILHYYKATNFNNYTIEYADERSLEEVSVNFSEWTFDYSKMLDVYEEGKYTQEQADAVAQMMYIAGAACKMKWSSDQSSGQWPLVALDKYFNIKANFYIRQAISTDFWMQKIQENLAAGKPILYTGTGVSNSAYSAHIFILDGIDADNYVHINWGWNGNSDGYYDITFCHPDFFSDTADGYYMNQMMICDIEPRKVGETYKERYIATSSTTVNVFKDYNQADGAVTGVTNNSYEALSHSCRIIYRNVDNSEVLYESSGSDRPVFPNWSYLSWKLGGYSDVDLPNGKWEIKLQTLDGNTQEVIDESTIPMRPYLVRQDGKFVEGGYLVAEGEPYPAEKELLFMSFEPVTDVIAKAPFYARVKTRSLLNDARYSTTIHSMSGKLCFTNLATGKKYVTKSSALIYDLNYYGLEYEGVVQILPPTNPDNGFTMPAGEYVVTVVTSYYTATDNSSIEYSEPIYVTVKGAVDYPILSYDISGTLMLSSWHYGSDYYKKWDESVKFRHTQYDGGIVSSNNNYNSVVMMLFAREADNPDADEIMITAFNFDPATGFNAYSYELAGNLYPLEGKYIFYFRYLTPDGERNILPAEWDWVDKATGLPAEPTPHFISANPNAGLPMIEVQTLAVADNTIQMTVKNIAQNQFNGKVFVTGFDAKNGECIQVFTDEITIASNETRQIEIPAQLTPDAVYDLYVKAIATTTRSATNAPTLTTKPDGSIAHFEIGILSDGLKNISVDKNNLDIVVNNRSVIIRNMDGNKEAKVYSVDGRLIASTNSGIIEHLTPGMYILTVGHRSAKVLIK
jgi:hypothetical protein